MKKLKLIVILFSMIITYVCYAQSGWFWQNPLPQGNDLYSVKYVNNNTAFATGGCGTVLKTLDGGFNWMIVRSDSGYINNSLFFNNLNTGWIVSSKGIAGTIYYQGSKIMKTVDSGNNWVEKFYLPGSYMYSIEFTSIDTGFVTARNISDGFIFKTINGGENWTQLTTFSGRYVNNTYFTNNLTGYIVGTNGINKTTNGGNNWQNQYPGAGYNIKAITYMNSTTAIAVGIIYSIPFTTQLILVTTNSGNDWTRIQGYGNNFLDYVKTASNNTVFACGDNILLKSTNAGSNWTEVRLPYDYYRFIDFNSSDGLITGDHGLTLYTTNNGDNWINYYSYYGDYSIDCIRFINHNTGYAASGFNILKTTNAGNNWLVQNTPSNKYLTSVFIVDTNTIYAGGGNSTPSSRLIKSTNGGNNWVNQNPNINYFLSSIFFINSDTGFCCGSDKVSKTTDGGLNWIPTSVSGNLNSICFTNNNTGYVIGRTNGYKTTDMGNTWIPLPQQAVNLATSVYFINSNTGFTTNYRMQIRKTTDGGMTWNIKSGGQDWYLNSVHFINNMLGYAVGSYGAILKTTNMGETWSYLRSPTNNNLNSVFIVDTNECYITGIYGTIAKSTTGGNIIGLNQVSQIIPVVSNLSQNYPNPFNPQTKIKFEVPSNVKGQISNIKLVIYDLLGREVATLVNEELKPGTYEADWSAINYSSGVYFYKIISGEFVETKKMVLMK